jgi:pilus assembly protein Flp/PilA
MRELIRRGYVFAILRMQFDRDERGATMVEYGLLVALIAGVAIGTIGILGGNVHAAFTNVCKSVGGAVTGGNTTC